MNKALAIVYTTCICAIILCAVLLPGARLTFLLPAAVVCGGILAATYRLACRSFYSTPGEAIIVCVFSLIVCGIILNIWYFTTASGGTFSNPILHNSDSHIDWYYAMEELDGQPHTFIMPNFRYYIYIVMGLCAVFGRDIGVPLMFNALCFGLTIIAVGAITFRLTANRTTSVIAMAATSVMCYLLMEATVLLKDVPLTLCMAVFILGLTQIFIDKKLSFKPIICLMLGIAGVTFLRLNMLLMLVTGAIIFMGRNRNVNATLATVAAVIIVVFVAAKSFMHVPQVAENVLMSDSNPVLNQTRFVRPWDNLLGTPYYEMSIFKRLLWLPASVVVQFLIPFPWNYMRDTIFGPTEAIAHFGYFWYLAGAVFLFWIFRLKKVSNRAMVRLAWWGVFLTVATAFMTSGRVSRYCLPLLPTLLPAVAFTINRKSSRKPLLIWLGVFSVLLCVTLITCYQLQMYPWKFR